MKQPPMLSIGSLLISLCTLSLEVLHHSLIDFSLYGTVFFGADASVRRSFEDNTYVVATSPRARCIVGYFSVAVRSDISDAACKVSGSLFCVVYAKIL